MSETEPASEEATMTANGSGPPSERASAAAVSEKKDKEEKNGVDEKKDSEENKDLEGKKEKENGMKMVEDAEEERQDKKTENVIPAEPEDVKMVDADDSRKVDAEDVKMVDAEVVKDEGEKGKEIGEEERLKPEEENNVRQEKDDEETEKQVDENQGEEGSKKKRMRGPKVSHKGEAKEKKGGETKSKEPSTPVASSIERPVRERKTVERLVEVIEKGPNRDFLIEKGRGTPLKDIPNVAYKLARKKPADLKLLHQTLFGRRGKAVDFKNHILQFSGFVWHESDEKQKAKMKEKLDKYVKDTLLDLCDLFDISVSRATTRKEDLVAKLLDFMAAPHAQTDVILAEREQQSAKSRKRKRVAQGSASKSMGSTSAKRSRKKHSESEGTPHTKERNSRETDDEDEEDEKEDDENGIPDEEETPKRPESEVKESESEEEAEEDEDDEEHSGKVKRDNKRSPKQQGSVGTEKSKLGISSRKAPHRTTGARSPIKRSSSKRFKAQEDDIVGEKVFSRKKKDVEVPKKKSNAKQDSKEKGTGEKVIKGKVKPEAENPSKEELRKKICTILKEVDFNTATFTDILKQLATHYKVDLTPRKAAIKLMIQEELTKLADEDEENEDEEDAEEGNPEPAANEVEA